MTTESDIQKMADIIAEKFHPEKIILFGSHARGETDEDSDVDLLVIMKTEERRYCRALPIRKALRGFSTALDILVRTPEEFEKGKNKFWNVLNYASREGSILYEGLK